MATGANPFEYITYNGEDCVRFKTTGKYQCEVIVNKSDWDNYLSQYTWTVSVQNKRMSVKTSKENNTEFIWKMIISRRKGPLDIWGTTIDHINNDPLDNRYNNLRVFNTAILNSTNISSKFDKDDRRYIHKVTGGYKIHFNLGGEPYYLGHFSSSKYGSDQKALEAAKKYRDEYVLPERERIINEMIKKTRNVEFERGLRDKLNAGELDDILTILRRYGIEVI